MIPLWVLCFSKLFRGRPASPASAEGHGIMRAMRSYRTFSSSQDLARISSVRPEKEGA